VNREVGGNSVVGQPADSEDRKPKDPPGSTASKTNP
jgi:hypothetical protein